MRRMTWLRIAPIASKLAPTLDLRCDAAPLWSELARDDGLTGTT